MFEKIKMSNIFLKKCNNKISPVSRKKSKNKVDIIKRKIGYTKYFLPANKEWSSSIYTFNKSSLKLLPAYSNIVTNLIRGYFNLYDPKDKDEIKKKRMSRRMRVRLKRLSINRIFVSKSELKHTNSNVIVTCDLFNPKKRHLVKKLVKIDKSRYNASKITNNYYNKIINMPNSVYKENFLNNIKIAINAIKKTEKKRIRKMLIVRYVNEKIFKPIILNNVRKISKDLNKKNLSKVTTQIAIKQLKLKLLEQYKFFIYLVIRKELSYNYYNKLISFDKSKFTTTYLSPLNALVKKIYNKKIRFNLVNLKYFYLNSDIFAQILAVKMKNNKKRPLQTMKKSLSSITPPLISKNRKDYDFGKLYKTFLNEKMNSFNVNSFFLKKFKNTKDVLNKVLLYTYLYKRQDSVETTILNNLENKVIHGVRIQASGRLTKRLVAARSVTKVKYLGGLKNINSSYGGLPSIMLRGHARSNLQYTNINSKNRIGSYGLKVWLSSI